MKTTNSTKKKGNSEDKDYTLINIILGFLLMYLLLVIHYIW